MRRFVRPDDDGWRDRFGYDGGRGDNGLGFVVFVIIVVVELVVFLVVLILVVAVILVFIEVLGILVGEIQLVRVFDFVLFIGVDRFGRLNGRLRAANADRARAPLHVPSGRDVRTAGAAARRCARWSNRSLSSPTRW